MHSLCNITVKLVTKSRHLVFDSMNLISLYMFLDDMPLHLYYESKTMSQDRNIQTNQTIERICNPYNILYNEETG